MSWAPIDAAEPPECRECGRDWRFCEECSAFHCPDHPEVPA